MKILIHASENAILMDIARHMQADLGEPMLLYEIENSSLAAIAVALGGRLLITEVVEHQTPIGVLRPEDFPMPETPLPNPPHPADGEGTKAAVVKLCEICEGPIIDRRVDAKTCSDACQKERMRRHQLEKRQEKLRVVRTQKEASAVVNSPLSPRPARNPD